MTNRKLKKSVVYVLYVLSFVAVVGTIYVLEVSTSRANLNPDSKYVDKTIFDVEVPVVNLENIVKRPYTENNVSIIKSYYDYQSEAADQEKSLLYFENTYLQNSGVDYAMEGEAFDVKAILDGTVISIKDNELLGKTVEIRHDGDLISVYQSLGEVKISENEEVLQGQVIGTSGNSNIATNLGNHLHFELIHNGLNVNPENYYDKKLGDL